MTSDGVTDPPSTHWLEDAEAWADARLRSLPRDLLSPVSLALLDHADEKDARLDMVDHEDVWLLGRGDGEGVPDATR